MTWADHVAAVLLALLCAGMYVLSVLAMLRVRQWFKRRRW